MSPGGLPGGGAAGELGTPKGASWAALRISVPAGGKSESNSVERGRATPERKGQVGAPASAAGMVPRPPPESGHLEVAGGRRASRAPS